MVGRSYAKALFDLARERDQAEAVGRDLAEIAALVEREPALREVLGRPWIPAADKRRVAEALGARLEVSPLARDFLALVAARGRADRLGEMTRAYRGLLDEAAGRVRARVRSAVALTGADREALAARLGAVAGGKQVILEAEVDARLLGGFVAEIGSLIVDGSLDGQLAALRERLARG